MKKRFWLLLIPGLVLTAFSSLSCMFPLIGGVNQTCSSTPGMVDATFHWIPSTVKGGAQYLDVSWYSTFPPNGFIGSGPIDENQGWFVMGGLRANTVHHYRVTSLVNGNWYVSATGTFTTLDCGAGDGSAPSTGLRLIIPKIGVNAPVNVRVVPSDGTLGIPNGKDDAIWYDFGNLDANMGGFPGIPGANAVFSGHVDYHPHFEAVFWDLRQLVTGDEIDVQLLDGSYVKYIVDWAQWMGENDAFTPYATKDGFDRLTIVTCIGTFQSDTHSYTNRLVVRATRVG